MFKNPLFLEGVRLCCSPRSTAKSGETLRISWAGLPDNPLTSKAASPLISPDPDLGNTALNFVLLSFELGIEGIQGAVPPWAGAGWSLTEAEVGI
ncbi:hypothetical protein GQ457_01G054460 [Hibiscus cannabinus]